jgi:hypothetical protein
MSTFCTDIDLLHWEPTIFKDAAFVSQTLLQTTADVDGTSVTINSGSLTTSHIEAGGVITLGGSIDGSFPIVEVNSAIELTLSVLYDKLFDDPSEPSRGAAEVAGVDAVVRTFWAQRRIVTELLLQSLGLGVDEMEKVLSVNTLKRAAVLGTLQMIYSALAAAAGDPTNYVVRMQLYETLYRRSLRSSRVELELDLDGEADTIRTLSVCEFIRK